MQGLLWLWLSMQSLAVPTVVLMDGFEELHEVIDPPLSVFFSPLVAAQNISEVEEATAVELDCWFYAIGREDMASGQAGASRGG